MKKVLIKLAYFPICSLIALNFWGAIILGLTINPFFILLLGLLPFTLMLMIWLICVIDKGE